MIGKVIRQLRFEKDWGKFGHWCVIMKRCSQQIGFIQAPAILLQTLVLASFLRAALKEHQEKAEEHLRSLKALPEYVVNGTVKQMWS